MYARTLTLHAYRYTSIRMQVDVTHSRYIMHVISLPPRSVGRLIRRGNVYRSEKRRKVYRRVNEEFTNIEYARSNALKTIVLLAFLSRFSCENAVLNEIVEMV